MSKRVKNERQIVPVEFRKADLPYLDRAVRKTDLDRSKFVRAAVREKMATVGVVAPEEAV